MNFRKGVKSRKKFPYPLRTVTDVLQIEVGVSKSYLTLVLGVFPKWYVLCHSNNKTLGLDDHIEGSNFSRVS